MLAGAAGAAGGALNNAYLRADTLEEALASLKRAAGLSNLSDQEAVEKAQRSGVRIYLSRSLKKIRARYTI